MTMGTWNLLDAQRQYLDALKKGQEAVELWGGMSKRSVPRVGTAASLDFPSPAQVVENVFAILEDVIAAQKQFGLALVGAADEDWA